MDNLQLDIDFLINNPAIRDAVRRARLDIKGLADGAEKDIDQLDKGFTKLSRTLTGVFSVAAVKSFLSELIGVRGQFQQIENSLTTILKSQDAANGLMREWKDLTLRSPYTLSEIAQSGKQLLAYGVDAKNVTKNIEQLANVASGVSQPLGDIAYLYGTLKTQGRAYQMDINQFTNRGIPIVTELAKVMKVADTQVRSLVEAGKVGFPEIEQAIANMTGPAGQFFNLIGKQAETLPGQINRLKHEWELMINEMGTESEGILASGIGAISSMVENYHKILEILGVLIATYGAYKAAIIATTVAQAIATEAAIGYTVAQTLAFQGMLILEKMQKLLNKTMLSNPYVAVATALAALASYMYLTSQDAIKLKTATELTTEAIAKQGDSVTTAESRLRVYVAMLKNTNLSEGERLNIYDKIKAIDPSIVEGIDAKTISYDKLKKGVDAYIVSLREKYTIEANESAIKASLEQENKLKQSIIDIGKEEDIWSKMGLNSPGHARERANRISENRKILLEQQIETNKLIKKTVQTGSKEQIEAAENDLKIIESQKKLYKNGSVELATLQQQALEKQEEINNLRSPKKQPIKEDIEIKRAKQYARDLGDVIGNFDKLLTGAQSKSDISKVKEAITEKIDALAPGDEKINEYKEKLKKVNAIEAQYGLSGDKKNTKDAEQWGNKKAALMDKIAKKTDEITAKGQTQNEKEILDARRKYTELRRELEKFNSKAPKGQRIGAGTFTIINDLEKKETGNIEYDQNTEKLKITLDKQKQLYSDFEEYKKTFGEAKAKERFAKQLDTEKNYLQKLETELAGLDGKTDLTGVQMKRKEMLVKEIEDEKLIRQQEDDKRYAEAYEAAKTYGQKEIDIKKQYAQKLDALLKEQSGAVSNEQRENLDRSRDEAIEAAKTEALAKTEAYKRAAEDVFDLTREQVKTELKALKQLIADGTIVGEAKTKVEQEINKLEFTLKIGIDQTRLDGLKAKLKALTDQLNKKDGNGISLVSKDDFKRIKKQVTETVTEIKKLENPISGKTKSKFIQGLDENFQYLKGSTKQVSEGVSNDLGRVSGSFNELSQAFGGTDTQAGYLMGTIADLAKVGSDAAGSFAAFASGDIVGGVTKAISAVAGLFSIGKKVKEMNEKARKEVEDFYANAIAGERTYQDLLKQRALQTVRDNQSALNGIGAEIKLRQSQMADWKKESDEIMRKLAGMSFTASEEYKHGTWFRKAEVIKTYGSLGGMDIQQLSQLLAQGKLEGDAKALVERLKELEQKGYDTTQAMASLADEVNQLFTGTTVDGLTDSLLTMFREGKTGFQDMADFFESSMQDAALSVFRNKVLAEAGDSFYKEFAASSKDGLNADKIANLKTLFNSLMGGVSTEFENLKAVTGLDLGKTDNNKSTSTMTESIKGITSDEAGLIAGQFGGQRIATLEGNDLKRQGNETATQQLTEIRQHGLMLVKIEDNTRRNAESVEQYLPYLKEIASKMNNNNNALRAAGG